MALPGVREDFPSLKHVTHFNSAGMAPMPTPVIDELLRIPRAVGEEGPLRLQMHDEDFVRADAAHATLARFLGVDADDIAFTTQFSTGVSLVVEGLAWQPGDEIIVSDQEHPALLTPVLNIARRRDLVVRRFPVSHDGAAMLSALAALLGPRTRLLAISHITTETGTTLPVMEMTRLAQARGALVLLDGAHTVGQVPLDLRATGCDFCAMVGYKWLFGPYPSAALYIAPAALERIEVTWTGSRVTTAGAIDMDQVSFISGARRFEYGGRPFAYDNAMVAGVEYVAKLGTATVLAHAHRLAADLHAALARVPGTRILSSADPAAGTGIVTVAVEGVSGPALAAALLERWGILQRSAARGAGVRISLAAFTSEADLDRLVEAIATVAAGR
ncbi:MAG: aminotransferase class V-fold PLP-dependent enzyme [Chloroflexi bacterium]|nr:aminotransferase class V-fold PLP-dependent enzyme [Chloroflexota bacterium]